MASEPDSLLLRIRHRVSLAGRVDLENKAPVAGASIELRPLPARSRPAKIIKTTDDVATPLRSTVSNADGTFHFIDLPAGEYELVLRHSLVVERRFVALAARAKVTVTKENETASAKPALPPFMTIELKPVA